MDVQLTPEQQELLVLCEANFIGRYTENDPDYHQLLIQTLPPIVYPWYNHARRNYDWSNGPRREQINRGRWRDKHHRNDNRYSSRQHQYQRYR